MGAAAFFLFPKWDFQIKDLPNSSFNKSLDDRNIRKEKKKSVHIIWNDLDKMIGSKVQFHQSPMKNFPSVFVFPTE